MAALLCGWSDSARGECGDHATFARLGTDFDVAALTDFRSLLDSDSVPAGPRSCNGPHCSKAPAVPLPSAPGTAPTGDRLEAWARLSIPDPSSLPSSLLLGESVAIRPHHQGRRLDRPPRPL